MRDHPLALAAGPSPTSRRRATIADACRCHVTSNLHHTANMANPRGWQRQCEPGTRGSKPLPRAAKEVEELRAQPGDPACRPAFGFDPRQQPDRQLGGRGGCHEALGIFNQHNTGAVVVEENKRHATIAHTRELQARGL